MCENDATTKEHVPPKCFFRKDKDFPQSRGQNRKQLIKVPSCLKHNTEKSGDDEYLRLVLTSYFGANSVAREIRSKPIRRSINRNPKIIKENFTHYRSVNDHPLIQGAVVFDKDRFDKALDYFARGLYFHEFGEKWLNNDLWIISNLPQIRDEPEYGKFNEGMFNFFNQRFLSDLERKGENSEVFFYKVLVQDGVAILQAVFYEAVFVNLSFGLSKYTQDKKG